MVAGTPNGPVAEFCAALRDLQRSSGITRTSLARQLHYGRSQLYEILDGRIKRPPEWTKLVEPLVRACSGGRLHGAALEQAVADWRRRHELLLRAHDELTRPNTRAPDPAGPETTASRALADNSAPLWPRLAAHPFVQRVCDGQLSGGAVRRWLVNDYYYNVEYQRFIAGLAGIGPTDAATEFIGTAISGARLGLIEIRGLAERFSVDLDAEPEAATVGLAAFLQAQVSRGYEPAIAAFYAAERVYFDTWSAIRPVADRSVPYWRLVEYWSSEDYGHWIASLGRLVDAAAPDGPSREMYRAFTWVVRLELLFWEALDVRGT